VVSFTAADSATAGDATLTVKGQGASTSHTSSLTLRVVAPSVVPAALRMTYIRGDARRPDRTSIYHSATYDPKHKLFFVANSYADRVDVISTESLLLVGSIPVPQPMSVDVTRDGKVLIGTATEVLFIADAATRQVTARVPIPEIHRAGVLIPYTFPTFVAATANGTILMRIDQVFTSSGFALMQWDPAKGTFTDRTDDIGFVPNMMARSADRSKVLIGDQTNMQNVAVYDAATDRFTTMSSFGGDYIFAIAINGHGTQFAVAGTNGIHAYDSSLHPVWQCAPQSLGIDNFWGIAYGADGNLYLSDSHGIPEFVALSSANGAVVGYAPAPFDSSGYPPATGRTLAADDSGLILTSMDWGVTLADTSTLSPVPYSTDFSRLFGTNPTTGAVNAANVVGLNMSLPDNATVSSISSVYFGGDAASNVTNDGSGPKTTTAATPFPGVVNVGIILNNGWKAVAPDAFTFGPQFLRMSPTGGAATGGTQVKITGYGFGFDKSQIQVLVGGAAATVTDVQTTPSIQGYPFPENTITVTVPAGSPGLADLAITTPAGSTTAPRAFRYLKSVKVYPVANPSAMGQVAYDKKRHLAYITNVQNNEMEVFSLDSQAFTTPIRNVGGPIGVAVSPDTNTLAVTNTQDGTVSILDAATGSLLARPNVIGTGNSATNYLPYSVVFTSLNKLLVSVVQPDGVVPCLFSIVEVSLGTYQVTARDLGQRCISTSGAINASADGSKVFVNDYGSGDGYSMLWTAASDTFTSRTAGMWGSAVSEDGNRIGGAGYNTIGAIFDGQMRQIMAARYLGDETIGTVLADYELHPTGSLLMFPEMEDFNAPRLEIVDANHGNLRDRVELPEAAIAPATRGAVLDDTGNTLFLLSKTGLTVVQFGESPLGVGSVTPSQISPSAGTQLTVRGSGFQQGITAMIGGTAASVDFVGDNTLHLTAPALPAGGAQLVLTNPDGERYILDAAVQVAK
jgi:DNA-binding beta-propeller fold protein YncE